MEKTFDLAGTVQYALRREVMAWRTYERLAELAPPGEAVNMMHQLVGFEIDHVKQFTEVLREQVESCGLDPDALVKAAEAEPLDMGGYVDEAMLSQASLPEVLKAAQGFERAMASFYNEAAAAADDSTVAATLKSLADQEESHEEFIGGLIDSLAIDPESDPEEFPSH